MDSRKRRYKDAFALMRVAVHRADPYGLSGLAPEDEYDTTVHALLSLVFASRPPQREEVVRVAGDGVSADPLEVLVIEVQRLHEQFSTHDADSG